MLVKLTSSSCKSCISNQLHSLRPSITNNNVSFRVTTSFTTSFNFKNPRSLSTIDTAPPTPSDTPVLPTDTTSSAQTPGEKQLTFFVARTKTNHLPVYETAKRGGNLLITTINHVSGDFLGLSKQLQKYLDVTHAAITIKPDISKILVRGRHSKAIKSFLEGKQL